MAVRPPDAEHINYAGKVNTYVNNAGPQMHKFQGRNNYRRNTIPPRVRNQESVARCRGCNSTEHFIRSCPTRFCQACGAKGHDSWSPKCARNLWLDIDQICDNTCTQNDIEPDLSAFSSSSSVVVKANINSELVNILLDTGAGVCLIDMGTLEQLVKLPKISETKKTLTLFRPGGGGGG